MTTHTNYTVLITGGSRGLGLALAHEFLLQSAIVIITSRSQTDLEAAAALLPKTNGKLHLLQNDLSLPGAASALAFQTQALVGTPDLVVNNASDLGAVPLVALADTHRATLERVFSVNLFSPFEIIKSFLGPFINRNSGDFVNISSDAAIDAYPNWGSYGISKAAFDHLTRSFASETKGSNVRFLSFDPGEMNTKMHADAVPDANKELLQNPADVAKKLVRLILKQRDTWNSGDRVQASQVLGGAL